MFTNCASAFFRWNVLLKRNFFSLVEFIKQKLIWRIKFPGSESSTSFSNCHCCKLKAIKFSQSTRVRHFATPFWFEQCLYSWTTLQVENFIVFLLFPLFAEWENTQFLFQRSSRNLFCRVRGVKKQRSSRQEKCRPTGTTEWVCQRCSINVIALRPLNSKVLSNP